MAEGRARATRGRGQRGAASQRLVLALAASALLTAAVSLPMAYQAHEARQQQEQRALDLDRVEVLGTTTVKGPEAVVDTLFYELPPAAPVLLHRAEIDGAPRILLVDDAAVRADFRVDDGPVQTDTTPPFELDDGAPVALEPGRHSVTATVTSSDGTSTLHQAFFTAVG